MELHRYIPFESLVDIVINRELTFTNPLTSWDDGCEGLIFRALQTKEGQDKINTILKAHGSKCFIVPEMGHLIRCQCWAKSRDSIAMWSMYQYEGKTIMIKTTDFQIMQLTNGVSNVQLHKIDYFKTGAINSLEDEIEKSLSKAISENNINVAYFFTSKRDSFQHEEEVRAISSIPPRGDVSTRIKNPLRLKIENPINEFIEEVLVHPKAPDYYVDIVISFCKKYAINCSGKSNILHFPGMVKKG